MHKSPVHHNDKSALTQRVPINNAPTRAFRAQIKDAERFGRPQGRSDKIVPRSPCKSTQVFAFRVYEGFITFNTGNNFAVYDFFGLQQQ